jgi:hypothetical protein
VWNTLSVAVPQLLCRQLPGVSLEANNQFCPHALKSMQRIVIAEPDSSGQV